MPYPFVLPTTSSFSFSSCFASDSHPSLPLAASTFRGVVRDTLKRHKRLPPAEQSYNLSTILLSLNNYVPYLLAIDSGLGDHLVVGEELVVILKSTPSLEWRPTISDNAIPGRETARLKIRSLEYEIYFVLSTLAYTHTLSSRAALHPLYSSATSSPTLQQRSVAINTAIKCLLSAASIHDYLARRSDQLFTDPPCGDVSKTTFRALTSLALAEATLLAVLKDDPYPAAVAQDRNKNDKDWMIKSPDMPQVRAHLFARLCLAAAEHAANASSLLNGSGSANEGKIEPDLVRYVEDLRRASKAKAYRFFGIDAELGGQTGTGIAWMQAGLHELGLSLSHGEDASKKGLSFGRLKKEWNEKREDKRIERGTTWGSDGGRLEESRVLEMLEKKWSKENDTINTQIVPPISQLIATMPLGREIHSLKEFVPPTLDSSTLTPMRAPPERADTYADASSDDEKEPAEPPGAFPGAKDEYTSSSNYY